MSKTAASPGQTELMLLPASALKARRLSKKHGHAAVPGSGPAGETCGGCIHLVRRQMAKAYLKCGLMQAHWTGGQGSDVRAGDPACRRWETEANAAGTPDRTPSRPDDHRLPGGEWAL